MSNPIPALRQFVSPGVVLGVIACGTALMAMVRSEPDLTARQAGAVRVVYVPAETDRKPDRGPAVTADLPQIQGTEWVVVVDGPTLAKRVEAAATALSGDGYAIVSVTPILRGEARTQERQGPATQIGVGGVGSVIGGFGTGWGSGYSVTDGVLIVAERR
ncbi:hypothetical protein [Tautonia sociabilis]|uniref:Uncharacterized protein n=1 Tax=Tautonia sociabilis TaxID=2080755 RepID=A0A432MJ29_9BACT|nr:hypothetical protein [Tautonia sociabilis]RUL87361.1 hypothetical protein TsocGM_12590 [Tautonia sociabilis]